MALEIRMAVMKKSVRKKLSKYLKRLVKKHGAEMTLALLTGIVSSLAADRQARADRKAAKSEKRSKPARPAKPEKRAKPERRAKPEMTAKPEKVAKPEPAAAARKAARAAAVPAVVVRKRTDR
jgi:hypothetical protein